jgi:regulator of sigma E protease
MNVFDPYNLIVFMVMISLLMFVHELGHFITARRAGIVVQEFGFGLPPRLYGYEYKGVIYSLNWIPFGAFVKMLGEEDSTATGSFASKSKLTRFVVLAAGSGMNFLAAGVVFAVAFMLGVPTPAPDLPGVQVAGVAESSPASEAGLTRGDVVVGINGQPLGSIQEFQAITQENRGRPITLQVKRGEQDLAVTLTPRVDPPPNQGSIGVQIQPPTRRVVYDPLSALGRGFLRATDAFISTPYVIYLVAKGQMPAEVLRPIGLPGMAQITSQAVERARHTGDIFEVLSIAGVISAGLAFANLLPIPALDGGRILFVVVEAIRGTRISPEKEGLVHFVGIILLISLMVLIAINDIRNPIFPVP